MVNPPQGGEYRPLLGDLFPESMDFDYREIFSSGYFFHKYYLTQRNLLTFAKRPTYVNYEVLTQCLNAKPIDYSKADIYELKNSEMSLETLEKLLFSQNEWSVEKFAYRAWQLKQLDQIADNIKLARKEKVKQDAVVRKTQEKSFEQVMGAAGAAHGNGKTGGREQRSTTTEETANMRESLASVNEALTQRKA